MSLIAKAGGRPKLAALLIGIDDYAPPVPPLDSCRHDAVTMASLLADTYGYSRSSIEVLTQEEATGAGVERALTRLADAPADHRLFFFSGHGETFSRGTTIEECLLCFDGARFEDDQLVRLSATIDPASFTVILDCCFSGGDFKAGQLRYRPFGAGSFIVQGSRLDVFKPRITRFKGFQEEQGPELRGILLAACQEQELAAGSRSYSRGLSAFTFALITTLVNKGLTISNEELIKQATQVLEDNREPQVPVLRVPQGSEGLAQMAFLGSRDWINSDHDSRQSPDQPQAGVMAHDYIRSDSSAE